MRKVALVCAVVLTLSTTVMGAEIAVSSQGGWMSQSHADTEVQVIVDNVTGAPLEVFTPSDLDALADWVEDHTGDGVSDLLVMFGIFPATIYPAGNAQPDGSLAEAFLDDGNCIINTGDYIFYVGSAGNNDAGGLANMMDVPAAAMWGDDSGATTFTPTADGELYTPSLPALASNRPWFPAQFEGTDWQIELVLAQNSDGSQVHPAIFRNAVTGGRLGVFFQWSDDSQPRGQVISEWINNWYLNNVDDPKVARDPDPADGADDVAPDSVLSWKSGIYAATHDVYFGTSFDDVNDGGETLVSQGQSAATFDPEGALEFGATYYWRVDEVNSAPDNTVFRGDVWSFTAEPFAYSVTNIVATTNATSDVGAGPENTINGSGINSADQHSVESTDMWVTVPGQQSVYIQYEFDQVYKLYEMLVWNYNVQFELMLGFGLKDVTVEYSENGVDWTVLGDVEFAQATARSTYTANTTVAFEGVAAKYVRLNVNSGWGPLGQFGLSEVRFMYIPASPREPQPADGAANVDIASTITWRSGRNATAHEVYFGTDPEALPLAATTDSAAYDPGALDLGTTYYWQVTEVQDAEAWTGALWSFSIQDYVVVEGFESYNDEDNRIYDTWLDGWVNETGSTVGHMDAPFAERSIVHGGRQSMPLFYDNAGGTVSEADFELAQNWAANNIQSLSLYFYGAADNDAAQLYVKINNTKVSYDGDAADLKRTVWQPWNIDLSTVGNVSNVRSLTIGIEGSGAAGIIYVDDIRLYPQKPQIIIPAEPDVANLVAQWTFDGNADDSSGNGHNGTVIGAITFANDPIRGQVVDLPGGDDQYIAMGGVGISGNMPRTIACWAKADNTSIPDWTLVFGFTGTAAGEGGNGSHFNIGSLGGPGGVGAHCWGWEETIFSDEDALEWHHYAMSYDGTTIQYYGDGIPMDTDPAKSNVQDLSISSDRVHVGSRITQTSSFPGQVDDAVIYNVTLTDGEVAWLAGRTEPIHKEF